MKLFQRFRTSFKGVLSDFISIFSQWKEEIDSKVLLPNGMPLPIVLLGNKSDIEGISVDRAEIDRFVLEKGFVGFFETSAKTNTNIDKAARFLVEKILEHNDIFNKKKPAEVCKIIFA